MRARRLLGCGVAVLMAITSSFATSAGVAAGAPGAGAQTPPPCPNNRPCELSVGLPGNISDLHVSPDSARVVFRHRDSAGVDQIYSAPVAGGAAPVKLNVTASATFRGISPDSRRVLYSGPPASGGNDALFSVPIEGPASAGIRIGNNVNDHITEAKISPDSRKVVFETLDEDRLIAVPIAGPANAGVRLTDRFVANGHLASWEISANSGSVVYGADQDIDEVFELYRVPLSLVENPDLARPLRHRGRDHAERRFPRLAPRRGTGRR